MDTEGVAVADAAAFVVVVAVFVAVGDADCVGKRFTVQPVTNKEAITSNRTNITVIGLNRIHLYKW